MLYCHESGLLASPSLLESFVFAGGDSSVFLLLPRALSDDRLAPAMRGPVSREGVSTDPDETMVLATGAGTAAFFTSFTFFTWACNNEGKEKDK
jgi:hypothetical protein